MTATPLRPPPLSLYIHLPWCVRKCPYCDFNSHTAPANTPRARYIDALLLDLRAEAARTKDRPLISVFFGGGTPSLFAPSEIASLVEAVREHFDLDERAEVTMEANPGTLECGDPLGYRQAGVNRLSVGAQSFCDTSLAALGRIHSVDDIQRSFDAARVAGFTNINLDLMYGLPGQGVAEAAFDLQRAIALRPEHISWYQLTLEPNTVFHARPPADLPDDDLSYAMQTAGQSLLAASGYERYEISAYASNGRRCRHNLNYWSFGDYLAVGAGAHGKVSGGGSIWRYAKPPNPLAYMELLETGRVTGELTALDDADRVFEFMLNALRLTDGFTNRLFEDRTGLSSGLLEERLTTLQKNRLIEEPKDGFWRVTGLGQRFLNDVQAEFLP